MWRACFLALLILPGLAGAEIYRWVDEDGVVHYGDRPPGGAERVDLPSLQRMDPVSTTTTTVENGGESAEPPAAPAPRVRLDQPRPEQTFRDTRGRVPATVGVSPELEPGQRLIFYLDGRPVSEPTRNTSMLIEGVVRGEHRLSVAVVAGEEEIARSEPVTFFMHPPSALSPTGKPESGAPTAPPSGSTQGAPGAPRPTNSGNGSP